MATPIMEEARPARSAPDTGHGRPGFWRVVAGEWTKVRTVRSTTWLPIVATVLAVGMAAFVGLTESLQPDDTVLGGSLTGTVLALLATGCFGALVMSGEYATGTIRATLAAYPRRVTVLAAKTALVAALLFGVGLAACTAAYQVGGALLAGEGYAPGDPMPALLGVALCFPTVGVLGLALGAILRHTAGAIAAVLGVTLLPSFVGPLLGDWGRWVTGPSPLMVLQKLSQSSDAAPEIAGSLGAWPSLWLMCGYTAVALAVGAWLVRRRDG